ncbi:uncharacterized protein [Euphorbia lathyris]|uniref:uncharacterized protein n=1 Tax=Euphorbia lathyris TaxID=212925 RepID=UPI00331397CC
MAKDQNGSANEKDNIDEHRKSKGRVEENAATDSDSERRNPSKHKIVKPIDKHSGSESESEEEDTKRSKREKGKRKSRKRRSRSYDSSSSSDSEESVYSESDSGSEDSGSESESETEEERRRRKKKERRKRREKEEERERKRRKKEKEKKRKRKEKEERKKKKKERGKKGAVTNLWGKYGVIRETDMWNKRPEFTAWLLEVKQVNMESLPNWEEKQMFKEFMEDHNTATFPSKKYYNLDAYQKRQMEKEMKKGFKKVQAKERTIFNDEEQRRKELMMEREKQKEKEVEALKISMQSGMAQAMKEQAQLREEMLYQYKLGNFEAAAAIQRRLDPDLAM